ncbi:methyltransferase [Solitalea longa]|uniref:Methyltransferase n=1 Tax=Solitalea longa TaxID=2079460 RepID=A0A2S5A4H4_9SPHI|nr:class I SAM-dependent methyltransferase [Solitalea longa]POY37445.1 methyltransferase [Solitalea longa]
MNNSSAAFDYFSSNKLFDSLYSLKTQQLSGKHWTPMAVAQKASAFLAADPGSKILDIGSGVGKFCFIAANLFEKNVFCGIEQRKELINEAEKVKLILEIENVSFIHGDFTKLNFDHYQHFYFYNSFFENLVEDEDYLIDNNATNSGLYQHYTDELHKMLNGRPSGTKVATYQSDHYEIPVGYQLLESHFNKKLNFWLKK